MISVFPSCVFKLRRHETTHSAILGYPQEAATCSGVHPSLSAWFTLASCSTRKDTISILPSMQAWRTTRWKKINTFACVNGCKQTSVVSRAISPQLISFNQTLVLPFQKIFTNVGFISCSSIVMFHHSVGARINYFRRKKWPDLMESSDSICISTIDDFHIFLSVCFIIFSVL